MTDDMKIGFRSDSDDLAWWYQTCSEFGWWLDKDVSIQNLNNDKIEVRYLYLILSSYI